MPNPYLFRFLSILCFLTLAMGCSKDNSAPSAIKPRVVNTFAMQVNGRDWEPGKSGTAECNRTFNAAWSWLDGRPYFNITAYRDPNGNTGAQSNNILQLQVMDADATGSYALNGSYWESFSSHAVFRATKPDGSRVSYVNKRGSNTFKLVIDQFTPRPNTMLRGVKGSFSGTLYNEKDPLDSMDIKRGDFVFQRTNFYDFSQCE
ncbi:MAG: DUF5025 domain-containing protein [Sphingobacteriales bacterium]|nr:MAG: DUF5025 domain-containing protein [Sphingobacteriales bacterium]